MPIRTVCTSCAKKLQIPDTLAGKKVKCPACGNAFVALAAEASTAVKQEPPRPAPAVETKSKVSAKPLAKKAPPPRDDADDEDSDDRPVKSKAAAKPPAKKAPRPRDDDDDEEEELEEYVGESSKSSKQMWIIVAAAVLLLVGGSVGVYFLFFSGSPQPIAKNTPAPPPVEPVRRVLPGGPVALADLVPGDAWMFLSIHGEMDNVPAFDMFRKMAMGAEGEFQKALGFPEADVERVSLFTVVSFVESTRGSVPPIVVVVQTKKPFQEQAVAAAVKNGVVGRMANMSADFVTDQTLLLGVPAMLERYQSQKGKLKAAGVLEKALAKAATSKGLVASMIVAPEMAMKSPPELAAFRKTRAVFASLEFTDRLLLNASLSADDAAGAKEIKSAADGKVGEARFALDMLAKNPDASPLPAPLIALGQQYIKELKLDLLDKEVTLSFQADLNALIAGAMPAIEAMRSASTNVVDSDNLRQIALCWDTFHDANNSLPPQTFKSGLSWRVAILPYLEQGQLYQQFKLDEPWDSPDNIKLLPQMPKIYEPILKKAQPGYTFIQSFVGPKTINKDPKKGMKLTEIIDGTSNTIVVTEGQRAVAWTKPEDIQVAPNQPIALGGSDPKLVSVVYADGSVRKIPRNLDQKILRWLIDPADGNAIPNLDIPSPGPKFPPKPPPSAKVPDGKFPGKRNVEPSVISPVMSTEVAQLSAKLEPHLGAIMDADTNSLLLLLPTGQAKLYSYPDFKARGMIKLGAGPAHKPAYSKAKGIMAALTSNPKGKEPAGKTGRNQLVVYELRDLFMEGKVKKSTELLPKKTIQLEGACSQLCLSPDGESAYVLDISNPKGIKALRLNLADGVVDNAVEMPEFTHGLTMARDGKTLYALSHLTPRVKGPSPLGAILVIDAADMKKKTVTIPVDPHAVDVTKDGIAFVSAYMGSRTGISVVDLGNETPVVANWDGVPPGSFLKLSADEKRLYVSSRSPALVYVLPIPSPLAGSALPKVQPTPAPFQSRGEMVVSPDNQFLLCDSGAVFFLRAGNPIGAE